MKTRFHAERKRRRLGQAVTADFLRCSQPSIFNYDNGLSYPKIEVERRMENLFDLPIEALMAPAETENGDASEDAAANRIAVQTAKQGENHARTT